MVSSTLRDGDNVRRKAWKYCSAVHSSINHSVMSLRGFRFEDEGAALHRRHLSSLSPKNQPLATGAAVCKFVQPAYRGALGSQLQFCQALLDSAISVQPQHESSNSLTWARSSRKSVAIQGASCWQSLVPDETQTSALKNSSWWMSSLCVCSSQQTVQSLSSTTVWFILL